MSLPPPSRLPSGSSSRSHIRRDGPRQVPPPSPANGSATTMTTNGYVATPPQNYHENGRLYHGFRRGLYWYPCDEPEKDRMDIYHQLFLVARRNNLHNAPINPAQARILDVGCGTGIWAIDMADKYHANQAEVLGLDLVNIQPEKIPENLRFRINQDHESIWSFGGDSWDLIHVQQACGSVSNWSELYQKIYSHLKPGDGWIEQVEIDLEPRCDDGTLPPDSALISWYRYLADATDRSTRPIAYRHDTRQMLQAAGFIDIQETIIRAPYNSWPGDQLQKEIGRWYNLGLTEGLEALSMAPFFRSFNWQTHEIKPFIELVKQQMCNRRVHAYNNIHIWTARKPQQ